MSYIHDALRKAQKEKDKGGGYYDGVVSSKKEERPFSPRTWLLLSFVFLSFLIVIIFSWYYWPHITNSTPENKTRSIPVALEKPIAKKKDDAHVFYAEGLDYQKKGSLHDAKKKYLQVLSIEPNFVFALNNLGVIYLGEGSYPEARRLFEKAITLDPNYADPHYNLACVYAQLNDLAMSVEHLKTAIRFDKRVIEWARADKDLMTLHGYSEYEKMISGE
jgi:tetratricopeptide (TPR) repeat protein